MVVLAVPTPDVVVIGLGPGGEEVAGRLADAGLEVVGVDERLVGGECPYWGCIPSKIMVRAGNLVGEAHRIPGNAGICRVQPDWRPVARRVRAATDGWDDKAAVDRLNTRGATVLHGTGRLTGPHEVTVLHSGGDDETVLRPRRAVVLAVGSQPVAPPVPGLAGTPYWTNRELVETPELPESLLVLGGGAVGLELGQALQRMGCAVTVLEARSRLLPREEPEAAELLTRVLATDGLDVRTGAEVASVTHADGRFHVACRRGDRLSAQRLMVAVGRLVDLDRIGADVLGLPPGARALPVDERMRVTGVPGVWAVGDATGRGAFTHLAVYQADIAVRAILGQGGRTAEYHAVPRVTFTDPEIGAVGLTEAQARDEGLAVRTGWTELASGSRGFVHGRGSDGFVKLVAADGHLVGATAAGPSGGEILGLLTLAVQTRTPLAELDATIWAYPTFHRSVGQALQDLVAA
ncbi:NAD(P)/FAD-dependent oxidoreductase [Streptacidiphilus sp. PB12-B1b]|uniref:dihydrolipoyl dehydrogenase family protein n=1 Tax=Streptacidiphilus sp. PB12-B1b TaxID=2705012 RepID=UPI0015F9910F|nr:NAD(P)/FAD-dependent oxidoreductase [Streptacidiphilus sp. PB12-B1b]QMU79280.1 NAD(P)/FAD-dependent oxidoreductase [Streptacidiphilus sp. PB12-B1b]